MPTTPIHLPHTTANCHRYTTTATATTTTNRGCCFAPMLRVLLLLRRFLPLLHVSPPLLPLPLPRVAVHFKDQ